MNWFLQQSLEYASQKSYLDDLFRIYPTIPNGIREVSPQLWNRVEQAYNANDDDELVESVLNLPLSPIKDSYIAFLREDRGAISRNPKTVKRLACELRELSLDELYKHSTLPKEKNRQIGPMFQNWVESGALGFPVLDEKDFENSQGDAILRGTDKQKKAYAESHLNYTRDKGLDLLARVDGKYVIAEVKFLTDDGGHQKGQFDDAMGILNCTAGALKIAVIDGVPYIKSGKGMHKALVGKYKEENIMSALLLRNFLNTI